MNYVTSDIHNDFEKFDLLLSTINFSKSSDHLYILGDLFDRGFHPQPLEIYFKILELGESCTVIRGNHDDYLSEYIFEYLSTSERKRKKIRDYEYNTFSLIKNRLTEVDLSNLADWLKSKPLQIPVTVNGENFLLAHAQTSSLEKILSDDYYLMGEVDFSFLKQGIEGYVSICGHNPTGLIRLWFGDDYRPKQMEIWSNNKKNVYMIDCGCGLSGDCRLACLRLEDRREIYV